MSEPVYKPQVSDLIDMRFIPGDLQSLEESIEDFLTKLLEGIQYSDHLVFHARENDAKLHTLTLHSTSASDKSLNADRLPMRFVISNPDGIACAMEWQWPVKRYFPLFDINKIKDSIHSVVDLAFDFIDLSDPGAILKDVVRAAFPLPLSAGDPDLQSLKTELFANSNFATLVSEVEGFIDAIEAFSQSPTANLGTLRTAFDDLQTAWQAQNADGDAGTDVLADIIRARLQGMNLQQALDAMKSSLAPYMGNAKWEDFEGLLLPYFRFNAFDVQVGIEFSEKWLRPIKPDGSVDTENRAKIDFSIGDLKYDTRKGFSFDDTVQANLKRSMIGNSGLVITLQDVIPDFSRSDSPQEIRNAGYGDDFRGAYIELAMIELPSKWFHPEADDNSLPTTVGQEKIVMALTAEKMVFGSGDFSGVLRLQPVKAVKAS